MEPLVTITILAIFGEVVIEVFKPLLDPAVAGIQERDVNPYLYLSAVLGVALAVAFEANLLTSVGLDGPNAAAQWIGTVGTGLILGRGANFVHDVIARVSGAGDAAG